MEATAAATHAPKATREAREADARPAVRALAASAAGDAALQALVPVPGLGRHAQLGCVRAAGHMGLCEGRTRKETGDAQNVLVVDGPLVLVAKDGEGLCSSLLNIGT